MCRFVFFFCDFMLSTVKHQGGSFGGGGVGAVLACARLALALSALLGQPAACEENDCASLGWESAPEWVFNPLAPMHAARTHAAFRPFRVQWFAFDPLFIHEAFGARVDFHFDCSVVRWWQFGDAKSGKDFDGEGYRQLVPSRSLACLQHEALLRLTEAERPACVRGFFPPVDEEYIYIYIYICVVG